MVYLLWFISWGGDLYLNQLVGDLRKIYILTVSKLSCPTGAIRIHFFLHNYPVSQGLRPHLPRKFFFIELVLAGVS